jgi:hypothetical protein
MKWLMRHFYRKHSLWLLAGVLALALVGCKRSGSGDLARLQSEGGVDVEVVAGQILVGDAASTYSAGAGETILLTKGRQLGTESTDGAEVTLAGDAHLSFAPGAVIELTESEGDASIALRQLNGVITFDTENPGLTVSGSTGLVFGPAGLDRVEFVAKAGGEESSFVVDVDHSAVTITNERGGTEVALNEEVYQLRQGESLRVKNLDQIEISRAVAAQPSPTPHAAETEANNLSPGSSNPSGMVTRPVASAGIVEPAVIARAETMTPQADSAEINDPPPESGDLSSSEAAPKPVSPPDNARLSKTGPIKLMWQNKSSLDSDTWFELRLWSDDDSAFQVITMIRESEWQLSETVDAGEYQWQVRLIRMSDRQYLSPPSAPWHFQVLEPVPTPTPTATTVPSTTSTAAPSPSGTESVSETPTPVVGKIAYAQPILVAPDSDKFFAFEEPVVLEWQPEGALGDNQWYEVRLWRNGTEWAGAEKVKEPQWTVPAEYNPGRYGWRVAVITVENGEWAGDISPESKTRFFTWSPAPPPPGDDSGDSGGGKKVGID